MSFWAPFFQIKACWAPFLLVYSGLRKSFQRFCPDLAGFSPNQAFGGELAPHAPPPPTPVLQTLHCSVRKAT